MIQSSGSQGAPFDSPRLQIDADYMFNWCRRWQTGLNTPKRKSTLVARHAPTSDGRIDNMVLDGSLYINTYLCIPSLI